MPDTIIDLIRHGEPMGGRAFRGSSIDDPLSEKGWVQMKQAIEGGRPWQCIVSSPMRRCREFAELLSQEIEIPIFLDDRLKEVGFGQWEGKTREQVKSQYPQQYKKFYTDPVLSPPPGAEPLEVFRARVTQAFDELLQNHRGSHCLLVSHAGVMRAIIAQVLHAESSGMYQLKIANAGLCRIRDSHFGPVLESINHSNLSTL